MKAPSGWSVSSGWTIACSALFDWLDDFGWLLACIPTVMCGLSKIVPTAEIRLLVVMELWLLLSDHRRPPAPPPAPL